MICHVVLIRLKNGLGEAKGAELLEQARKLLAPIPGVHNLRLGRGVGKKAEVEYPYALVMEFEDENALQGYQVHRSPEYGRIRSRSSSCFRRGRFHSKPLVLSQSLPLHRLEIRWSSPYGNRHLALFRFVLPLRLPSIASDPLARATAFFTFGCGLKLLTSPPLFDPGRQRTVEQRPCTALALAGLGASLLRQPRSPSSPQQCARHFLARSVARGLFMKTIFWRRSSLTQRLFLIDGSEQSAARRTPRKRCVSRFRRISTYCNVPRSPAIGAGGRRPDSGRQEGLRLLVLKSEEIEPEPPK